MKRKITETERIAVINISNLLYDNQLSRAKLAAMSGIPIITMNQILNSRMVLRVCHLHKIAEAFDLPPYQLLMKNLTEEIPELIERMRNTPGSRQQALTDLILALPTYMMEPHRAQQFSLFKLIKEEPTTRGIIQVYQTHVQDKSVINNFCTRMKKAKKIVGIEIYTQLSGLAKIAHPQRTPKLLAKYSYNRTTRKGEFNFYGPKKPLLAALALEQTKKKLKQH